MSLETGDKIIINGNEYTKVGQKLGFHDGGFFKDSSDQIYYIKFSVLDEKSKTYYRNEALALELYQAFGIKCTSGKVVEFSNGGVDYIAIMTKKIDGLQTLKDISELTSNQIPGWNDYFYVVPEDIKKQAEKGFLIDALLASWDAVGILYSNMCVTQSRQVIRLDTGGSLLFRARGGPKGLAFSSEAREFESLLDPKVPASSVFSGIHTSPGLMKSLVCLLSLDEDDIKMVVQENSLGDSKLDDEIIRKLSERRKYLMDKAFQKIVDKQIIPRYLHSQPSWDTESTSTVIKRLKHGGMHASRSAIYAESIVKELQSASYEAVEKLNDRDILLIKIACIFHDSGRKMDSGKDYWEAESAKNCMEFLKSCDCFTDEEILRTGNAIASKDNIEAQRSNIYALVLAASDSLDWVRSHGSDFDVSHMPKLARSVLSDDRLNLMAIDAIKLTSKQGDLGRSQSIAGNFFLRNFSLSKKEEIEHNAAGCYSATQQMR